MKVLFQTLCEENVDWDVPLLEEARKQWNKWLRDLKEVQEILVPWCVYEGVEDVVMSYSLHGFGDASEKAYCAVVYLVLEASSFQFC